MPVSRKNPDLEQKRAALSKLEAVVRSGGNRQLPRLPFRKTFDH